MAQEHGWRAEGTRKRSVRQAEQDSRGLLGVGVGGSGGLGNGVTEQ